MKPGFASFGVEVASWTSSPIKFGSLTSPNARRLRRLPEVCAVSSVASVLFAGRPCPAERVGVSFLSALVETASATLFVGVGTSRLGAVYVDGAVDTADAAVLALEAALVDAAAVDVAGAALTAGLAS